MKSISIIVFLVWLSPHFLHGNTEALGQENATWAKSIYFRGFDPTTKEKLNDKVLSDFAKQLNRNRIRFPYLFAGPYQNDGHLPPFVYSETAGIHIDIEYVMFPHADASTSNIPEYGKNWILFHKRLRSALPG